jgi:N-acetylmuramoyl-L-alanine amidase
MNWNAFYKFILALVVWREAGGEGREGMRAVAHVIRNRVLSTKLPDTWDDVIEGKWQFSSMTAPGDGMLVQWPSDKKDGATFGASMEIAESVFNGTDADPTNGATHYANLHLCDPAWAHTLKQLAVIGNHTFFA